MPLVTEPHVYKSNALIEASYRLSLQEQRILLACISKVDRSQPITDEQMYRVTAKDLAGLSNTSLDGTYTELKEAADTLFERRLTIYEQANDGKPTKLTLRWVQAARYVQHEGAVELRFGHDILPYLTELSRRFTKYALSDIAQMNSAYAIRLYELLMQWREIGKREVSIDWLRERLDLTEKYPATKDLKRWVLDPSIEQINTHTPIKLKYEQRKTGRKITHITFTFTQKKTATRAKIGPSKTKTAGKGGATGSAGDFVMGIAKSVIERNANPGESYEQCAARLKRKGITPKE